MINSRSRFASLPPEDQSFILKLCADHSYEEIVGLLRQPRDQGGLGLVTSRSALCRFYTSQHLSGSRVALAQSAAAAQVWHERDSTAFFGAICGSIQARVLENVMAGKALADLENDLRVLRTAHRLYLADARWRATQPKEAQASYKAYVASCARQPEADFVLTAECPEGSPARAAAEKAFSSDLSGFDADLCEAREAQRRQEGERAHLRTLIESLGFPSSPAAAGPVPPKTPVIPHIPPDSTFSSSRSPAAAPKPPSQNSKPPSQPAQVLHPSAKSPTPSASAAPDRRVKPAAPPLTPPSNQPAEPPAPSASQDNVPSDPQKPVPPRPFVRAQAKPERNRPCPCGSGKKYKRCCGATGNLLNNLPDLATPLAA